MDVPVPRIMETTVEVVPSPPQERVQIGDVPVPRTMEASVEVVPSPPLERVQNRTPEQIVDIPVLRTMEERVPSCIQEQIMDLPVPQIMVASKAYTGKVFIVDMRHHRGDQACPVDTLGFNIKGLDKHTMPQISEDIVLRERIIACFGHSISWDSLEAALSPGLFRAAKSFRDGG